MSPRKRWPRGGGEAGKLIRSLDWSETPLGAVEDWPQSLRTSIEIMLGSGAPVAVFWGPDDILLYNDPWSELIDEKHPEALGRPAAQVFPDGWDELRPLLEAVRSDREKGGSRDEVLQLDGRSGSAESWSEHTFTPISGDDGSVGGVLDIAVETPERRSGGRKEKDLRDVLLEIETVGLIYWNADMRIHEVNDAFLEMTGFDREDALGRTWQELTPEEFHPASEHAVAQLERDGEITPYEKQYYRADGSRWWGFFAARKLNDELAVEFVIDITGEKARQLALHEAKEAAEAANRAKSAFMARISHELRTPLNAILGYCELLLGDVVEPLSPAVRQQVQRVGHACRHLRELIEEVLAFSRLEAGNETTRLDVVAVSDLLDEILAVIEPLARDADLRFRIDADRAPETIRTDPRKLRQILVNLLGNAVKFTDEGGVTLRVAEEDGTLVFEVADTGRGIEPGERERLFDAFWQGRRGRSGLVEGTGLGLTISKRYVDLLDGDLAVASTPGEGTVITVRLPARRPAAAG